MRPGVNAQFHALVEEDLNQERAGALGRAGSRLGRAVAACDRARTELELARAGSNRAREAEAVDRYRRAFARYQRRRTEFCIQREANRLFDHRLIDRFYPPPPHPGRLGIAPERAPTR